MCCKIKQDLTGGALSSALYPIYDCEGMRRYGQNTNTQKRVRVLNWHWNFLSESLQVWWSDAMLFQPRSGTERYMGFSLSSCGCWDRVTRTWLPGQKIYPRGPKLFSHDPLRIRSIVRKWNKKILPLGTQHLENYWEGEGVPGSTFHSRIRKWKEKFLLLGLLP